jgi:hypothetical protein
MYWDVSIFQLKLIWDDLDSKIRADFFASEFPRVFLFFQVCRSGLIQYGSGSTKSLNPDPMRIRIHSRSSSFDKFLFWVFKIKI